MTIEIKTIWLISRVMYRFLKIKKGLTKTRMYNMHFKNKILISSDKLRRFLIKKNVT